MGVIRMHKNKSFKSVKPFESPTESTRKCIGAIKDVLVQKYAGQGDLEVTSSPKFPKER
jgi:hypothetical protein